MRQKIKDKICTACELGKTSGKRESSDLAENRRKCILGKIRKFQWLILKGTPEALGLVSSLSQASLGLTQT